MPGQTKNSSQVGLGSLTDDQVNYIRRCKEELDSVTRRCGAMAISKDLGISVHIVRNVFQDRTYAHVLEGDK